MAEASWTKKENNEVAEKSQSGRLKFVIGGIVLLGAIAFLVVNAMSGNTQLYKTVDEFYADKSRLVGRDLRVAGWVIGETVEYEQIDATTSFLEKVDVVDSPIHLTLKPWRRFKRFRSWKGLSPPSSQAMPWPKQ